MAVTVGGRERITPTAKMQPEAYIPWVVGGVALALVVYFDLQAKMPLLDEFARRWTLERLASGHGLVLWGRNPGLVQLAVAAPLALAHVPSDLWRLTLLPFLAVAAFYTWRIASLFGADRFWASVAATTLICAPSLLSLTTGFMNEPALLGLMMAAIWYSLCWIREGRRIGFCVILIGLATLQRQQGATLAAVTVFGVALSWRQRPRTRSDLLGLVTVATAVVAALAIPYLFRPGPTPGPIDSTAPIGSPLFVYGSGAIFTTFEVPVMLALLTLPFAVAILKRPPTDVNKRTWWGPPLVALLFAALFTDAFSAASGTILPNGYLNSWGLGVLTLPGNPQFFPAWFLLLLNLTIVIWALIILGWRRQMWSPRALGFPAWLLLLFAAGQLVAVFSVTQIYDRYYFPVVAPVIPLLASIASRAPVRRLTSHTWAIAILVIGVAIYAAGEQNYMAWQVARDKTAQLAYQTYPAYEVNAGFEETAQHVWIPLLENPGRNLPRDLSRHPRAVLLVAAANDPRPGYRYSSLVPGKIVLQVLDPYPRQAPDLP